MICPNCGEKSRDVFEYCRHCGSKLSGELSGDFKTEMLNVFRHSDGYIYLFSVNGNQVILKAESLQDLAEKVNEKRFPWGFRDGKTDKKAQKIETVKTPLPASEFLKASSLKSPEILDSSSSKKAEESYVPEYEVSRVIETSIDFSNVKPKRNPSKVREIPESEISTEFGIRGVFKEKGQWAFRTNDIPYTLHDDRLVNLQNKVEAKEIGWEIIDEILAREAYNHDEEKIRQRDSEILLEREQNKEFYENKDKQITDSSQKRTKEVEGMLEKKNMDRLLK
ncbi:zinc ribbon domain-containing protein [Methanobrevibacter sp.]|uniref:zinc ribbon domain-containing protein n=1 Tax=Methanobrevibacter sp. TaxID=66852 RepID=UPI0038908B67